MSDPKQSKSDINVEQSEAVTSGTRQDKSDQNRVDETTQSDQNRVDETTQSDISNDVQRCWYVLRVQSGKEDRVKANLDKRIEAMGMQDKIFQVMVPTELVSDIRKEFTRKFKRKLYPGYVMVEMLSSNEAQFFVKATPGVGDFAGVMSDAEVEQMILSCDQHQDKPKPKVAFHKGQNIKIKEGAFENYDGIVDEVNEQKGIIKVRIVIFGRHTQVELGYWQVESI